jgi:UDP-glucose-4-epimerase GalE
MKVPVFPSGPDGLSDNHRVVFSQPHKDRRSGLFKHDANLGSALLALQAGPCPPSRLAVRRDNQVRSTGDNPQMTHTVLVIGGAGYIGAHACKRLKSAGWLPVVLDDLSSGHEHAVRWGPLVRANLLDRAALKLAFDAHQPSAVMHFAASIDVAEGERDPIGFWRNNVAGVIGLLDVMQEAGCENFVFSSTCATYGIPDTMPITEATPQRPINVYGRTKLAVETLLSDAARASGLRYAALRYFNAAGASPDGEIGEEHDPETHLIPNALAAAAGRGPSMAVFGDDYPTRDGTCLRDYIHVSDLADAHYRALERLKSGAESFACNLGSGTGSTVLEILNKVEGVTGRPVPYRIEPRRRGDPPELVADTRLARQLIGFEPVRSDTSTIIEDAWRFYAARWGISA